MGSPGCQASMPWAWVAFVVDGSAVWTRQDIEILQYSRQRRDRNFSLVRTKSHFEEYFDPVGFSQVGQCGAVRVGRPRSV
jgi:hypothetical protein